MMISHCIRVIFFPGEPADPGRPAATSASCTTDLRSEPAHLADEVAVLEMPAEGLQRDEPPRLHPCAGFGIVHRRAVHDQYAVGREPVSAPFLPSERSW